MRRQLILLGLFLALGGTRITYGQFQISEADKRTPTIDGDPSEWQDYRSDTLHMSWAHNQRSGNPVGQPLEIDIRYAWDEDNFYVLVEETTVDDDPAQGEDAFDWCGDCDQNDLPGAPWFTDSVGFYDKGIKWPDGEDLNVLAVGPFTQFWVGFTSDPDSGELRHMTRSYVEGASGRLIGPDSHDPGTDEFGALLEPQSAFGVLDGKRIVEFFMQWDQIRYDESELDSLDGHTLQDVTVGYEFRLDPLLVDGLDGETWGSQTHPNGAEHPHPDPNIGITSLDDVSVVRLVGPPSLQAGDADQDFDFDQLDLVKVQIAAKYLTGQAATWGEGDWDGAPGGSQGDPPAGDGLFDQSDIIAALSAGYYLRGPYAALQPTDEGRSGLEGGDLIHLPVPEPSGLVLTAVGAFSTLLCGWRRRGQNHPEPVAENSPGTTLPW